MQTLAVQDLRPPVGDAVASARVVKALPLQTLTSTAPFSATLPCATAPGAPTMQGPEVVYAFTPSEDVAVEASTCGSDVPTALVLLSRHPGGAGPATCFLPSSSACPPESPANGVRQSVSLSAGETYYLAVKTSSDDVGVVSFSLTSPLGSVSSA